MSRHDAIYKIKLLLRGYSIFFTLSITVALVALIYELRNQNFSLHRYLISIAILTFVFAITALPFDCARINKDKRMCSHFGINYDEFLFKSESEQDELRSRFRKI